MLEVVFTLDYEIYGNGEGSLKELVYEPARKLKEMFAKAGAKIVVFVEAAELEMIETNGTDPVIDLVKKQVYDFHSDGFELGLHLHPQWYNGRHENGSWTLDYSEYNMCTLPRERIVQIVDRSISYLRNILGIDDFIPFPFRAGNWLLQPTSTVASVLSQHGIKVDSSVFKGGLQRQNNLDYRPSLNNGDYWNFSDDVNVPDPRGNMLELPIHTQMVPPWKMFTSKRVGIQQKASSSKQSFTKKLNRLMDFMRFTQPLKLDFCRMTLDELTAMLENVINKDQQNSSTYRPLVAIGHTKDLVDFDTVELFLTYLDKKGIVVSTFEEVYHKIQGFGGSRIQGVE